MFAGSKKLLNAMSNSKMSNTLEEQMLMRGRICLP